MTDPAPTPAAAAQSAAFLEALLGYVPADRHALLWTLQDKRSTWLPLTGGTAPVAKAAQDLSAKGRDVYCAVSVAAQPGMYDTRIKSTNAAGIMGLWADIDIADPDVHKKWNLPPDEASALELLDRVGLPPTLVVHSGHGLQAWWLLQEFWSFDTDNDRLEAAALAQRWNTTLQVRAAEKSWVVDSTFDLARVMRIPGTLNRKGSPVMPVRLLSHDEQRRYNPEDFDQFCVDASFLASRGLTPQRSYVPDQFELTEDLKPDFERFQALIDNDERFERTWKMKRPASEMPDQSPSSYDMSLASQAVRAGWTDKEVAALILAFRRTNKLDISKALRPDYIRSTIARARDSAARQDSSEVLDEVGEALDEAKRSGDDEQVKDARRAALDVIGQQLGLEVLHIIKYVADPPQFALVTPTCTIPLRGADGILVWQKFRQAVWESVGHQIDRFSNAQWDRLTKLVPRAWEEQDVGSEATELGETATWLGLYLSLRPPVPSLDEAAINEYPYIDDGHVMMFGPAFRRWLFQQLQERLSNAEIGRRLRAFGCSPHTVNVVDVNKKRTSRSAWRLPASLSLPTSAVVPADLEEPS